MQIRHNQHTVPRTVSFCHPAKKSAGPEKPLPPCVPPEPEVPGSLAIGAVSLAVAKSGARIADVPLYKHIAALSSQVVPWRQLTCPPNSPELN